MSDIKGEDIEKDADKDSLMSRMFAMRKAEVEIEDEDEDEDEKKKKKKSRGPKRQKRHGLF